MDPRSLSYPIFNLIKTISPLSLYFFFFFLLKSQTNSIKQRQHSQIFKPEQKWEETGLGSAEEEGRKNPQASQRKTSKRRLRRLLLLPPAILQRRRDA